MRLSQSGQSRILSLEIKKRFEVVQQRIRDAENKAGRLSHAVRLIAVSKTQPAEAIREAYAWDKGILVKTIFKRPSPSRSC